MSSTISARAILAQSLQRRTPTWQVAAAILDLGVIAKSSPLHADLTRLAGERRWGWSMNDDFDRVDAVDTQLITLRELFADVAVDAREDDVASLRAAYRLCMDSLGLNGLEAGHTLAGWPSFKRRVAASAYGVKGAKRRVRFLRDFADRVDRLADVQRLRTAQMRAKSRMASDIDAAACDDLTLAACAYLASRANRRSIFQIGAQSRAFDNISEALFGLMDEAADRGLDVAWSQVALVRPTKRIIERLDAAQRGDLIARFHAAMTDAADALSGLWPQLPERMRAEMVMVRGVDSSRWNAYAGAYNTMRAAWVSSVLAAGLDRMLDAYLPGKAVRLMAADVAWMYRGNGQDLHEDTRMFGALARPWDVVSGDVAQGRDDVLAAARSCAVDALRTGWVGPRELDPIEVAEAEPALVHGVVVADAHLASVLRRCGVFSAKGLREVENIPALRRYEELSSNLAVQPAVEEAVVAAYIEDESDGEDASWRDWRSS